MYDVIIIGDGAIASAIAIEFAIKHKQKVCIVGASRDRHLSGSKAASAMTNCFAEMTSESFMQPHSDKLKLAAYALNCWPEWLKQLEILSEQTISYNKGTYLIQNNSGGTLDQINYDLITKYLADYKIGSSNINPQTLPLSPVDQYKPLKSLFINEEGFVSSHDLLSSYSKIFERTDNIDHKISEVKTLTNHNQINIEFSDNSKISGKYLIVAAGFFSNQFRSHLPELNSVMPIYANVGYSIEIEAKEHGLEHVYRTPSRAGGCGSHIVPITKNTLYFGATSYMSMTQVQNHTIYYLNNLIPQLLNQYNRNYVFAKIMNFRLGHRPFALDKMPLVGSINDKNTWLVSGFNRDGLHCSPAIATELAKVILDGKSSTYLSDTFSPLRKPHAIRTIQESIDNFCEYHYSSLLHEFEPKVMASHDSYILAGVRNDVHKIYDTIAIDQGLDPQILLWLLRASKKDQFEYSQLKNSIVQAFSDK